MTWLIVLLIFAVVAGNLMWLMPSRRERQQMAFRQAAITKGMKVSEVKEVDGLPEICDRQEHWFEYALPFSRRLDLKRAIVLKRTNEYAWELPDVLNVSSLEEELSVLPDGVIQITLRQMSVVALWNERGEKEAVEHIHAVLAAFQNCSV